MGLALAILNEIRTVSEYQAVNEYYKRLALVSKTIVDSLVLEDAAFEIELDFEDNILTELSEIFIRACSEKKLEK